MDKVRVLRIVSYEGPRDQVEDQISRSIHGTKKVLSIIITATTLGVFPDIMEDEPDLDHEYEVVDDDHPL